MRLPTPARILGACALGAALAGLAFGAALAIGHGPLHPAAPPLGAAREAARSAGATGVAPEALWPQSAPPLRAKVAVWTPEGPVLPPRACYAFISQGDIYLSCGYRLTRITHRGDVLTWAMSDDGRTLVFAVGSWVSVGGHAQARLHVLRWPAGAPPEARSLPYSEGDAWSGFEATCGTVAAVPSEDALNWPGYGRPALATSLRMVGSGLTREIGPGAPLPGPPRTPKGAVILACSDDRATALASGDGLGLEVISAGRRPACITRGSAAVDAPVISPHGRAAAYWGDGGGIDPCVIEKPHWLARCIGLPSGDGRRTAYALGGPAGAQLVGYDGVGAAAVSIQDNGSFLMDADWDGPNIGPCYSDPTGILESDRPRPGWGPDRACPALVYSREGGEGPLEILHAAMWPGNAQWVYPPAVARLLVWSKTPMANRSMHPATHGARPRATGSDNVAGRVWRPAPETLCRDCAVTLPPITVYRNALR